MTHTARIGVVLSSGGGRGVYAHTGFLLALQKLCIEVSAIGEFGFLRRKAWTHQTYQGIDFPKVTRPEEDARSYGFRAEANVRLVGGLHGTMALDWMGISSTRPNTFTAHERTNLSAVTMGFNYRFGRR